MVEKQECLEHEVDTMDVSGWKHTWSFRAGAWCGILQWRNGEDWIQEMMHPSKKDDLIAAPLQVDETVYETLLKKTTGYPEKKQGHWILWLSKATQRSTGEAVETYPKTIVGMLEQDRWFERKGGRLGGAHLP